jgi:hypothetical protein
VRSCAGGIGLHFGLFLSTTTLVERNSVDVPKTFVAFLSLHGCLSGKGRLFALEITLGLWFGNLMYAGDWDCNWDGNASLFTSGHFWLGLGLGFSDLGLGLGWAAYLEIDPRMREMTWVGG